ncbi:MAG: cation:proton antiporter [Candidatus Andersenbacteria bacterium]
MMYLTDRLRRRTMSRVGALTYLGLICIVLTLAAAYAASHSPDQGHHTAVTFLWIAIILLVAKFSSLIERFGQPAVLGELLAGVVLGNLALVGLTMFEPIRHDSIIVFLAELGVVILLFQIGLESNIKTLRSVGWRAFLVAMVGVIGPFILGTYLVGPWLLPGLSANTYLFLGAALTATSVGITARVFRDLGKLQTPEAQIVLGAAVIDDVMGLIILAVVSAIVTLGAVSLGTISLIAGKAILFLVGAIVVGQLLAPRLGRLFSRIHTGAGMKFTLAISFGLIFAWLAGVIGLAPIVGAFAAGLVLDPLHFRHFKGPRIIDEVRQTMDGITLDNKQNILQVVESHAHRHIDELIEPLGHFLVPIFFVVTGMAVKLDTLLNPTILFVALGITVAAFIGKLAAGLVAGGKVRKSIVGWGMVPRGEVGLIFAAMGSTLGVISDAVYSVIVIMVIITTLLTPIILTTMIRRLDAAS